MKTRTGKIARLPRALRAQLNQRLQNGEPSHSLLEWLNPLPEVQAILKEQFGGVPLSKQNLSEWRQGGYVEWEFRQELLHDVAEMEADGRQLAARTDTFLSDHLTAAVTARYASLLRHWDGEVTDTLQATLKILHSMIQNLSQVRRWDYQQAKLHLAVDKVKAQCHPPKPKYRAEGFPDLFPPAAPPSAAPVPPSNPVIPSQSNIPAVTPLPSPDSHSSHNSPEPTPPVEDPSIPSTSPAPDPLPSNPVKPSQTTFPAPAAPPPRERTSYDVWPDHVAPEMDHYTIQSLPVQARPPGELMPNTIYDPQRGTLAILTDPDQPKYPGSLRWGKGLPPEHRPYRPTMCQGKCNLANGHCTGCKRTEEEITLWPVLNRPERVAYIHKILTRRLASGMIK